MGLEPNLLHRIGYGQIKDSSMNVHSKKGNPIVAAIGFLYPRCTGSLFAAAHRQTRA